ncbi:hypothetical protein [Porphyromonas gingivalis]|uniref:hypothetical protein n=1 Tax=Porphyromonas gingivalis TaxID=837 RepID=UPI000BE73A82|nr:hypothetical protein [Porphyromonas gingivalis]PDP76851.1 hypothetical protein CLI76_07520 [Porphyromonas gingivalis]
MKTLIKILVAVAVVVLAYLTVMSIYTPVSFDKIQASRETAIQKKLKNIADYQAAFESMYGRYATADELVSFLANGRVYYVNAEGEYTDDMRDKGMTEAQAARTGLLKRDTVWVAAKDSLLKGIDPNTVLDIPGFAGKKILVEVGSIQQEIGRDTIDVSVFQASVPFVDYLSDQDQIRLKMKINDAEARTNGYAGLRIGSLKEVKNTGNWE